MGNSCCTHRSYTGRLKPGREVPDFDSACGANDWIYRLKKVFDRDIDSDTITYRTTSPNFSAVADATLRQTPRFLYRISSDQSGGSSIAGHFKSESARLELGDTDFATLSPLESAEKLKRHLNNTTQIGGRPWHSPFISMTDSFPTAMYLGKLAQLKGRKNIQLHIIDTHHIEEPALMFHAYALLKALHVGKGRTRCWYRFLSRPTYTEFLAWEELKVHSAMIPFDKLWTSQICGLDTPVAIKLCDALMSNCLRRQKNPKDPCKPGRLRIPAELREKLYPDHNDTKHRPTEYEYDPWHGQRLKWSAEAEKRMAMDTSTLQSYINRVRFAPIAFQFELLIALLSMITWYYTEESIVTQIVRCLRDDPMCDGLCYYGTGLSTSEKREVYVQQDMMKRCCKALGKDIILAGKRPMRNLYVLRSDGTSRFPIKHTVHSLVCARRARKIRTRHTAASRDNTQITTTVTNQGLGHEPTVLEQRADSDADLAKKDSDQQSNDGLSSSNICTAKVEVEHGRLHEFSASQ